VAALLSYAPVPSQRQDLGSQLRRLREASCTEIFEESRRHQPRTAGICTPARENRAVGKCLIQVHANGSIMTPR
jgi:hypothetical protein